MERDIHTQGVANEKIHIHLEGFDTPPSALLSIASTQRDYPDVGISILLQREDLIKLYNDLGDIIDAKETHSCH